MVEHEPLIATFSHLKSFPREKDALHVLKKVASIVKPIMRARGWKVRELAEFYPDQQNLLGLNVNHGLKILLRLRYPSDKTLFLPIEQITDTMLHELAHIVRGPHDAQFHALWNQLREEHEALVMKGYTGEGFLSEGRRLGGRQVPMDEARRLARAAAEKRKVLSAGSGQRLGGLAPRPGQDIRNVIVNAIERRNETLRGCGNTTHNDDEIQEISDTAGRNGFRTKAEEDAANDAAIAQALWELVQEEEKAKYGTSYIPPSAERPAGNGGGVILDGAEASSSKNTSGQPPQVPFHSKPEFKESAHPRPPVPVPAAPAPAPPINGWTCNLCTLHNPAAYLSCDACGTERPAAVTSALAKQTNKRPRDVVDLTSSPTRPNKNGKGKAKTYEPFSSGPSGPATWDCSFCNKKMESQWWTCSLCGKLKDSS